MSIRMALAIAAGLGAAIALNGGAGAEMAAPKKAPKPKTVTVTGCPEKGFGETCTIIKAPKDTTYNISGANPPAPIGKEDGYAICDAHGYRSARIERDDGVGVRDISRRDARLNDVHDRAMNLADARDTRAGAIQGRAKAFEIIGQPIAAELEVARRKQMFGDASQARTHQHAAGWTLRPRETRRYWRCHFPRVHPLPRQLRASISRRLHAGLPSDAAISAIVPALSPVHDRRCPGLAGPLQCLRSPAEPAEAQL